MPQPLASWLADRRHRPEAGRPAGTRGPMARKLWGPVLAAVVVGALALWALAAGGGDDICPEEPRRLAGHDFDNAVLQGENFACADLRGATLQYAELDDADLRNADLRNADLYEADVFDADLSGADLSGANLSGAVFNRSNLEDANLTRADLGAGNFEPANLAGADLRWADLEGTIFGKADLRGVDLRGAHFEYTIFHGSNLRGARFDDIDLTGPEWENSWKNTTCPDGHVTDHARESCAGHLSP